MEEKNPIQSAQRIFSVYEYVCRSGNAGLSQITEALGLNKSTVHRMLASLIYMDYVKQDKFTGEYTPTFKTVELGQTILGRLDLPGRVRPYLQELSDSTGETVHLVRRDGTDVVYVDKIEPLHSRSDSIRMASQIGRRRPMYCAGVGKALMASMPENEAAEIWDHSRIEAKTEHTIVTREKMKEELAGIRSRGWALDDEENEKGVRCVAEVIPSDAEPEYAFSISAPAAHLDETHLPEVIREVLKRQKEISDAL